MEWLPRNSISILKNEISYDLALENCIFPQSLLLKLSNIYYSLSLSLRQLSSEDTKPEHMKELDIHVINVIC